MKEMNANERKQQNRWQFTAEENTLLAAAQCGNLDQLNSIFDSMTNQLHISGGDGHRQQYECNVYEFIAREVDDRGYSAAHWSAYCDELEVFNSILHYAGSYAEAVLRLLTLKGMTCLHIASNNNSIRVVRRICELQQQRQQQLERENNCMNLSNKFGETALHLAAAAGNDEVVRILLVSGAAITCVDKWQRTAYEVARQNGYFRCCDVIKELCGDVAFHENREDEATASTKEISADAQERRSMVSLQLKNTLSNRNAASESSTSNQIIAAAAAAAAASIRTKTLRAVPEAVEKHIFSSAVTSASQSSHESAAMQKVNMPVKKRIGLAKLIEYPGDPDKLKELLEDDDVDINGKDMMGMGALHKFAAWDKVDLLEQLLMKMKSAEEVNSLCGTTKERRGALHICVEMGAARSLALLLGDERIDAQLRDYRGLTYAELAKSIGQSQLLDKVASKTS